MERTIKIKCKKADYIYGNWDPYNSYYTSELSTPLVVVQEGRF